MNPSLLTVYTSPYPKVRLGKDNDGGYIIVDLPEIQYDILLTGGIDNDISFEEEFINMYQNVECKAYDGTISDQAIKDIVSRCSNSITVERKNISYYNGSNTTNLHELINNYKTIFVKMDIEGWEIPWIKTLSETQMDKFEQIVIEFHFPFSDNEIDVFEKINKNHYLVHFHPNNCCGVRLHQGVLIPNVFECTYLHKKHFNFTVPSLNREKIPTFLDQKNTENEEIFIDYPPFVHHV